MSEIEAAIAAERERRRQEEEAARAARDAEAAEAVDAAGRIYDALAAALEHGAGLPVTQVVSVERVIPATERVQQTWRGHKIVVDPERRVQEQVNKEVGRQFVQTVDTRAAEFSYRWREPYSPNDWRLDHRFSYGLTLSDDGTSSFAARRECYETVHSWSDMVGGEHHEHEWLTQVDETFATRGEWLEAVRANRDSASPLAPDSRLADAIVAAVARRLA